MHAKDAIRQTIGMSDMIMSKYLDDLDDSAFLVRPVAGMNHIAWQVGHLITSERGMVEGIKPGSCPPLPEGFEARHTKETTTTDNASKFLSKAEYMATWKAQRAATKAVLDSLSDADLDAPSPENLRNFCPTVGMVLNLTGLHPLMHLGQFVAVRREQKLPVAF
jgi:DinB superfamily